MNRILITTSSFGKDDTAALDALRSAGYEVILNPHGRKLTEDEVCSLLQQTDPIGMIAGVEPLTAKAIEQAKQLRVISRCGIGLDNIDFEACNNREITVLNTPDGPTQAVAELAIGLMLAGLRHIVEVDHAIRRGEWKRPMGRLLSDQTVGIIGCGRIGTAVARLLRSFGTRTIGHDPYIEQHTLIDLVPFEVLLQEADVVTLHVPYNESSHHIIDTEALNKMKSGALVVNTARANIIDEEALYQAIRSGKLAGACMDTFSLEPYSGPLTTLPQVILTSHIGSYAREARIRMENQAVENLLSTLKR